MLKLENVSFSYQKGKYLIKNLNLEFNPGEITMIIGKNGSGKTTLCNIISNFLNYKGKITLDKQNIKKLSNQKLRKKIGIIFQNPNNQIIFNKVYDDLKFPLENLKLTNQEERIKGSLKMLKMENYLNRNPFELSLGEKQRIAISAELAINPDYYIFDEITSMIDHNGKQIIYQIIKDLKSKNKCIIMTTNIMEELLLADRIIVLDQGNIKDIIKKEELLNKIDLLTNIFTDIPFKIKVLLLLKDKITSYQDEDILNYLGDICKL